MFMVLALAPVCFGDAQNEETTRPRNLVPTAMTVPTGQAMTSPVISGWVAASSADQSCVTTCGIASPIIAMEATSGLFVATNSATADSCICSGAIS